MDVERHEEMPASLAMPTPRFAALVLWDAAGASPAAIERVAKALVNSGAVYVCTWGSACELVHDAVDSVEITKNLDSPDGFAVITTWHEDESLDDVLWFFLTLTRPYDRFEMDCRSSIVVCIGQDGTRLARVRQALSSSEAFVDEVDAREESDGAA